MGLTEHEKRTLEELERSLGSAAKAKGPKSKTAGNARNVLVGSLVAVAGLTLLISAALSKLSILGLAGFAVMAAGVYLITKRR
jgi:hypothetical protein